MSIPPWTDGPMPDVHIYSESELFVAGALSTLPPFDKYHPAWALPLARLALEALSEWEPNNGGVVNDNEDWDGRIVTKMDVI